jgi:hypothetical protein
LSPPSSRSYPGGNYSDAGGYQDVGLAYPWVNVPTEIYGWEATNYNGISLRYKKSFAGWNLSSSIFRGDESVRKARYAMLTTPNQTTIKWNGLVGGDIELSKDWFTTRLVYFQSRNNSYDIVTGSDFPMDQRAYGLAVNLDFDRWFFLSEFTSNDRHFLPAGYQINTRQPAMTLGIGHRIGRWTLFGNWSMYNDYAVGGPDKDLWQHSGWRHKLFNVRYDINSKSDIKVQYDDYHDLSVPAWSPGNNRTIRISYDFIF